MLSGWPGSAGEHSPPSPAPPGNTPGGAAPGLLQRDGSAGVGAAGYSAAVELSRSLFSAQNVPLGVEHSLATGPRPCGLWVDAERARFVRRPVTEILNSAEEWEPRGEKVETSLGQLLVRQKEDWVPALSLPATLDPFPFGNLCRLQDKRIYGREMPLATISSPISLSATEPHPPVIPSAAPRRRGAVEGSRGAPGKHSDESFHETPRDPSASLGMTATPEPIALLVKPLRKLTNAKSMTEAQLLALARTRIPEWSGGGEFYELVRRGATISARIDFSNVKAQANRDSLGNGLVDPPERTGIQLVCREGDQLAHDQIVEIVASPAHAWRRLGLVETDGAPTRRGIVFGFFQGGEGLAIAAALEDVKYPIDDLVFDLANIRAGPRFAGEDAPLGGHLGALCQRVYERAEHPGYLELGVPLHYGPGSSDVPPGVSPPPGAPPPLPYEAFGPGVGRSLPTNERALRKMLL